MKLRQSLTVIDTRKHGLDPTYSAAAGHPGYCPVSGKRILGRYKYYPVAELLGKGNPIYDFTTACAIVGITPTTKDTQ